MVSHLSGLRLKLRSRLAGLAALLALMIPVSAYAQSCALCYQAAANSGANFIEALKKGIVVLVLPPLVIGCAIVLAAYRKRHQYAEE